MLLFFFFQAEDGIRDTSVTGVQTCALPISSEMPAAASEEASRACRELAFPTHLHLRIVRKSAGLRSEERRVGKECRSRGSAYQKIKKGESGSWQGGGTVQSTGAATVSRAKS